MDENQRRTRAMSVTGPCAHEGDIREVTPQSQGCAECEQLGDTWVELRLCLTCGHVGCCDSSKNRHATAHHRATNHPVVQAFPGDGWRWCYVDETYL